MSAEHVRIAIIGSGFAGLGMAIRLQREGIEDYVVLERADDVGGTWRDNTYPGCACDVPSHLYSFSFAPNPSWSRTFSRQPEIQEYLRGCAKRYGVLPHVRFGHDVQEAAWDDGEQRWTIQTSQGTVTADMVVAGLGGLSEPSTPDIPGLGSFEGAAFHSAQWDDTQDLRGKRVAVIGTGASAIQIVPAIQPEVSELHVYQRTPPWIVPRRDRRVSRAERRLYRALPAAQLAMRAGIYWVRELFVLGFMNQRLAKWQERLPLAHLYHQVKDRDLRRKLKPHYAMGCKRVLVSDDYYPAMTQPNVDLVTDGIREIRPHSIVAEDGTERAVDVIVLSTGFRVADMPAQEKLRGRGGKLLADVWQGRPQALRGTTMAGFPNLFMLLGPNTGLGHNSVVYMIESQIAYVMDCLRTMDQRGADVVEARQEAQDAFNERVQRATEGTVWTSGGCVSWYLDAEGKNRVLWPGFSWKFGQAVRRFDPAEYVLGARGDSVVDDGLGSPGRVAEHELALD
jgi:cation diffusion facilitator CzcD-associated flavoprotein CzcO